MADVNLSAAARERIIELTLLPYEPGLQRHVSAYNGAVSTVAYSPAGWQGTVTLAAVEAFDATSNALGATIQAVIVHCRSGTRTLALPLDELPKATIPASTTVTAVDASTGRLTLNKTVSFTDGDFFKIGDRIFQAFGTQPSPRTVVPVPTYVAAIGGAVAAADEITVRIDTNELSVPRTANRWGPWVIPFVEDI